MRFNSIKQLVDLTQLKMEQQLTGSNFIHKLVLTGGPCSGKTTGQTRLTEYFEARGWKVFRVPEAAATLLGGGVSFYDLNEQQVEQFEEDLIKTMMVFETSFVNQSKIWQKNCLIIFDRGCMDCFAYSPVDMWQRILRKCGWNNVDLRDSRYDQVVHLVTGANESDEFYVETDIRTESPEMACQLDRKTVRAWIGHPQINIIDSDADFDAKIDRLISCVCQQVGFEFDEPAIRVHKFWFLLEAMPNDKCFDRFEDFEVCYDFLKPDPDTGIHRALRKRGQNGIWVYQINTFDLANGNEMVKTIEFDEYLRLLKELDPDRIGCSLLERCFIWANLHLRIFIYSVDFNVPTKIILETETVVCNPDDVTLDLPDFVTIKEQIEGPFIFLDPTAAT